jgi:hypothetical protein
MMAVYDWNVEFHLYMIGLMKNDGLFTLYCTVLGFLLLLL